MKEYFTVTIKAGSIKEREQRVRDLLDRGFELVRYLEQENHYKTYVHGTKSKQDGKKIAFDGVGSSKTFIAIMRKKN